MNAYNLVIVLACVIISSHIFSYISKKTNIPSVILLILLGLGGKFVMDYYDFNQDGLIFGTLEVLGIIGLIMIVLEAAIDLELTKEKWPIIWKSFTIALISLGVCAFGISFIINQVFREDPMISLVYAIPLAITSSAIVIPSVTRLAKFKKEFMIYESTFSDILGIMFFYLLTENINVESTNTVIYSVVGNIIITIVISIVVSYALVLFFQRLEGDVKLFMLIAVLILLYAIGKQLHLSSLIIILVFGLLLNNHKLFFIGKLKEYMDDGTIKSILKDLHLVTRESAFVVRTFFFVVFGTTIDLAGLLDLRMLGIGLGIVVFIFLVRFVFLKAFFWKKSIFPEFFITPRGLITILLFFSIPEELSSMSFNADILLITIIATSLIMTWGMIKFGKVGLEEGEEGPEVNSSLSYFLQRMSSNAPDSPKETELNMLADDVVEEVTFEEDLEKENDEAEEEGEDKKDQ